MNINRTPQLLDLETSDSGAFVDLAIVARRHVDLAAARSLKVFTGLEPEAEQVDVDLPAAAKADPKGWWLCGTRQGARVRLEVIRGETGEAALAALRAKEASDNG